MNVLLGIVVIKSGYLVYINDVNKIVNVFNYKYMVEVIRFVGWIFWNVCVFFFDNFLVIMNSDDY